MSTQIYAHGENICGTSNDANGILYTKTDGTKDTVQAGLNKLNSDIDKLNENLTAEDNLQFKFGKDGDGNYGYYGADGSLIPFNKDIFETIFKKKIYSKGEWNLPDGLTIAQKLNINDSTDGIKLNKGQGFCLLNNTGESLALLYVRTKNSSVSSATEICQFGTANSSGTLPTIVSTGANRLLFRSFTNNRRTCVFSSPTQLVNNGEKSFYYSYENGEIIEEIYLCNITEFYEVYNFLNFTTF